jgi:poly(hydroxyalkanoate) depolymerase family esterase
MTPNFAAAMRRAALSTRAYDPIEATRIIQNALAKQTGFQQPAAGSKRPPSLRLIDPGAEIIPSSRTQHEPMQRKSLGDVLQILKDGKSRFRSFDTLRNRSVRTPPPPIADGAQFIGRSFACAAGARSYKLYIPASLPTGPNGLIVMLHGCKQNPDDFASGTAMNTVAETHGLIVAYPRQNSTANASSCWNWFSPPDQMRDRGEPAIIAGITRDLISEFGIADNRTFVAGLSAGGAMAAIMGQTYPDLYAGVGIHSGLAYGSATDVMSAFATMRGDAPRNAQAPRARVRTIVFHGSADGLVHLSNAERVVAQAAPEHRLQKSASQRMQVNGRSCTRTEIASADGSPVVEYWLIEGAGHTWSGGHPSGTYTDVSGPNASTEMVRFFLD